MKDRLQLAIELARRAGGLILEGQNSSLQISRKGQNDLVTDYDFKSEKLLVTGILEAYPEDRILAEEGTNSPNSQVDAEHLWLIDPHRRDHQLCPRIAVLFGFNRANVKRFAGSGSHLRSR